MDMGYDQLYTDFVSSKDTLRLYQDEKLVFSSQKERLYPLMDYLKEHGRSEKPVVVFDKVIGNAAACLAVKVNAGEVYSPLGSQLGVKTLQEHRIKYHFNETVPYIMRDDGTDLCPMEKLSMGKTPDEFYAEMKKRVENKS
jgi:hypothetical protein